MVARRIPQPAWLKVPFQLCFETKPAAGRYVRGRDFKLVEMVQPILIVEDEALIRMGLADSLHSGGFAVAECSGGVEAMGYIDSAPQLQGLITDIRLGEGPTGWEVARHARRKFANLPVVYVTGDSAADWTVEGVPGSVLLQKPYADAQMLTAMSNLLIEAGPVPPAPD